MTPAEALAELEKATRALHDELALVEDSAIRLRELTLLDPTVAKLDAWHARATSTQGHDLDMTDVVAVLEEYRTVIARLRFLRGALNEGDLNA